MDNSQGLRFDDALMGNPFADAVSPSPAREIEESTITPQHNEPEQEQKQQQQQHEEQEQETTTTIASTTIMPTTIEYDDQQQQHQQQEEEERPENKPITMSPSSSHNSRSNNSHNEDLNRDKSTIIEGMASLNVENQEPFTIPDAPSTIDNTSEYSQPESLEIPKSGSRPYFHVTVQDPQKVGDAINAHIIYKVKTKTNSPVFRAPEFVVARRYRDFLWLYNQLTLGNPGVIVPPVPEKHALGRFQDEFVESRRIALERCLQKIVSHPMLYGDPDLKVFLESESFNVEKRQKRAEPDTPKVSLMRSFGETISNAASNPFSKFVEVDEWFASKRTQLETLENQLKALLKSVEGVVKQRKELGGSIADFGESMIPLASAELDRGLSTHLMVLADVQKRMKELHEQQAHHDVLTLEHTIDEYIRIIGSIKLAFNARIKAYQAYQQAESDLQKKQTAYDRLNSQSKKPERLAIAEQEINEAKQKMTEYHREFQDVSKLIKNELDRFDHEKVEDFRDSVEQFLCSMIEHQKQIIALWESYFEQTEQLVASESQ
ncbi:Vps5 C terminal like-domain-containing protein [Phascolomyces articulosus]|uniref:Vps5 C terminal like-domain-containing protein n=1 Tax=Phascolomyces articulosus TaxID=60185 RepID=A0AAD5JW15_9FUNG|nr:Vps5 C terminal like-domain-containing protein [Phascolomyces articulosus]